MFEGCSKSKTPAIAEIEVETVDDNEFYKFYYFSKDGFSECENVSNSPEALSKPWTETFRVCDANTAENGDALLLINKLGLLHFPKYGEFYLLRDINIFEDSTAENLVFSEGEPFFTLYRNSFFTATSEGLGQSASLAATSISNRPYIVRASLENHAFYPVITYADMEVDDGEISGTFFDGNSWLSSIKTSTNSSTSFRYIFWKPTASLLSMQPFYHEGKISIKEINTNTYREQLSLLDFSKSPERLKLLLEKIPDSLDYIVKLKNFGGVSPRIYIKGFDSKINATAIISPSWICCIFEDGTTYFNGALEMHESANKGKPFAFRLPKLDRGFLYTDFAIAGNHLVVGWEEKDFFKVGKSGFMVADLNKILYEN